MTRETFRTEISMTLYKFLAHDKKDIADNTSYTQNWQKSSSGMPLCPGFTRKITNEPFYEAQPAKINEDSSDIWSSIYRGMTPFKRIFMVNAIPFYHVAFFWGGGGVYMSKICSKFEISNKNPYFVLLI